MSAAWGEDGSESGMEGGGWGGTHLSPHARPAARCAKPVKEEYFVVPSLVGGMTAVGRRRGLGGRPTAVAAQSAGAGEAARAPPLAMMTAMMRP